MENFFHFAENKACISHLECYTHPSGVRRLNAQEFSSRRRALKINTIMKLHLPKPLFAAVIAACIAPAAYAYTLQTGEQTLEQDETINDTQTLTGDLTINGKGWATPDGHTLLLETGANVSIEGNLSIVSQCHLNINGGALSTTGMLSIGHNEKGNPADLTMTSGNLSVSQIRFNGENTNAVSITGGTLTITGSNAIDDGSGSRSTLTIGGSGDASVTLKTGNENAVTFNYGNLQLGNVTIAADNAQAITITNATLNGSINNQAGEGNLILSGANTLGSNIVTISDSSYYSDETTASTSSNGYLHATYTANIGTNLTVADGATLTFNGHNIAYNSTTGVCTVTFTDMDTYYVGEDTVYTGNLTTAGNICVKTGATLDANGVAIEDKTIILQAGSTFANTGNEIGTGLMQNSHIALEGDATLNAASSMGIISSQYATSYLELNGHTLAKTGAGTVTMINTDISAGKVDIQEGTVVLEKRNNGAVTTHGTVFNVAEGSQLTFNNFNGDAAGTVILNATGTGTINVSSNTTIPGNTGDTPATSAFAGTVNVTGGQLSIGASSSGNNSGWKVQAENMGIKLNGGSLYYFGNDSSLGNLEVASNATYLIHDTKSQYTVSHKALDIAEDATLHIIARWAGNTSFTQLTGKGNLSLELADGYPSPNLNVTFKTADFSGTITNNGTLSIGTEASSTVNLGSTIANTGTLNLNGKLAATSSGNYELVVGSGSISYSEGDNGYRISQGSSFYLAKGGTINLADTATFTYDGTEQALTKTKEGLTFSTGETTSSEFFVNSGTVSESALLTDNKVTDSTAYVLNGGTFEAAGNISNNRLSYTSGALSVSTGNSLTIDTAKDDVNNLLLNTTGEGNIKLNVGTATLAANSATRITGDLIVNSGATLQLGSDNFSDGQTSAGTVDLSSLHSLTLNGGQVRYRGGKATLNKMTVDAASTFNLWDMASTAAGNEFNIDSMVLNSALNITSSWKYNLNIKALTGSGDLHLNPGATGDGNKQTATINVAQGYTGKILLDGNTAAKSNMDVNISVAQGATAEVKGHNENNFTTPIASLTLHNGSTLKAITDGFGNMGGHTFNLNTVAVEGEATIAVDGSNAFQGIFNIGTLTNTGETASTLTLSSNSNTSQRSVFNLNGGDYEGTIKIQELNGGSDRKAALNIKHATAAEKAVIEFDAVHGSVALGIAADEVTVRGIKGAGAIYSGEQASETGDAFGGDNTDRTLVINTAGNSYTTAATLGDHLNITKQGTGKQSFTGSAPSAIGTVKVEAGELDFANLAALTVTDLTVKSGATLTVSLPVQTAAADAVPVARINAAGTALLEGGSTINGGLDLTSTSTLTINNIGNSAITLNGALVLPDGTIALAGDILNALAGLAEGSRLNVFSGVSSLTLGSATYTDALTASADTDLSKYFSGVDAGLYQLGYTGAANGGVVFIQSNVPEPTTATLSLLALAALAARRRRRN